MKAVLVIDMPDCCNNCPCYDGMEDRSCCNVLDENMCFASYGRLGNCPLRPLPKGHGRLIDADELKKHKYHDSNRFENAVAVAYIDWADTIIEADTGETE